MCVLTFLPHDDGRFTITHNRDEHVLRAAAISPKRYTIGGTHATFPKDPQSGGTWFALHEEWVCCMLNGAFEQHISSPPYRKSRGVVIPYFLQLLDFQLFADTFNPIGMEPFTFIAIDIKRCELYQLIWDSQIFHRQNLPFDSPHIWSSSTLYNHKTKADRRNLFEKSLDSASSAAQIFDFHQRFDPDSLGKSLFVNIENKIKTVCIMQVSGKFAAVKLRYEHFYPNQNTLLNTVLQ